MKGLFLAQMERDDASPVKVANPPFDFVPYSYGPFAPAIYGELEALKALRLVQTATMYGKSYSLWGLTDAGWDAAQMSSTRLDSEACQRLARAYGIVTNKNFNDLLAYVYERYPDSASRSAHTLAPSQ